MLNERIKLVRVKKSLNQTDFAKRLSISRSAVCKIESGENSPSEQTISLICKEFNVNSEWLRTGKGEMFIERTRDEQIAEFVGSIAETDSFKQRFVAMLSALDERDSGNSTKDFSYVCRRNKINQVIIFIVNQKII